MSQPTHAEVMAALESLRSLAEQAAPHLAALRAYENRQHNASRLVANWDEAVRHIPEAIHQEGTNTPARRRELEMLRLRDRIPRARAELHQTEVELARARNPEKRALLESRVSKIQQTLNADQLRLHELETKPHV